MKSLSLRALFSIVFALVLLIALPAHADDFFITCSASELVQAVEDANATPEEDTIYLASECIYELSGHPSDPDTALPHITSPIVIEGNGITVKSDLSDSFRMAFVEASGTLTLRDVVVDFFSAPFGTDGGAIYNEGTLRIVNSDLTNNFGQEGGAIYSSSGTVTIVNSRLTGNLGQIDGGAIFANGGTLDVAGSFIDGNRSGGGGGIFIASGATATVTSSTLAGNHAVSGNGGGAYTFGTLTVTNSIVWGNNTQFGSGGTLTVTHSDVEGGIGGTGNIDANPVFVSPVADGDAPSTGGEYHVLSTSPVIDTGNTLDLPADTLDADNDDDTSETLSIDIDGDERNFGGVVDMGADENTDPCDPSVYNVPGGDEAALNQAVKCANRTVEADVITLSNSVYTFTSSYPGDVDTALPHIRSEIVIEGSGATLERDMGSGQRRMAYITPDGSLTLRNMTIQLWNPPSPVNGGAIYNDGTLLASDVAFLSNFAEYGGALFNGTGTATLVSVELAGGQAQVDGGAIFVDGGYVEVVNSFITGNYAGAAGGGIFVSANGLTTVINSTIAGNRGVAFGGGTFHYGLLDIINSIVWGNNSQIVDGAGAPAPTVTKSDVQGGYAGDNLNVDPLFVNDTPFASAPTTFGDYHLRPESPVINQGSNDNLPLDPADLDADLDTLETLPQDFDSDARILNGTVDMGADEDATCVDYGLSYTVPAGNAEDLRTAVLCANTNPGANTITLTPSTYTFTTPSAIDAQTALPHITSEIIIVGSGAIIERDGGAGEFRLFVVEASGDLTLRNVTVQNGFLFAHGGAIHNTGALTVVGSTLSNNFAGINVMPGSHHGGAIYNTLTGTVTIANSTLSGNYAKTDGGGIFTNGGTVAVVNTFVTGNRSDSGGGGIFVEDGATAAIESSTISGNTAGASFGGGVFSRGETTIDNSIVWGNNTQIAVFDPTTTVSYSDVEGGFLGIGNMDADPLFITALSWTAAPTTGGDYHIQFASPAVNAGSNAALPSDDADVDIDGNVIEILPVDRDGDKRSVNGIVDMGADEEITCLPYEGSSYTVPAGDTADLILAIECANKAPDLNTFSLTNSVYDFTAGYPGDTATALPHITTPITIVGNGAIIERNDPNPALRFFFVESTGTLTLRGLTLLNGTVVAHGGAIRNSGILTVVGSYLSFNTAGSNHGGAIYNASTGAVTVANSTLSGNSAGVDGGGIFNDGGTVTVVNTFVFGNRGGSGGGGMFNETGGTAVVESSTFAGNHAAASFGGGIYSRGTSLTVENSIVWGNNTQLTNGGGTFTVSFSDVEGGFAGVGNLNVDPMFDIPVAHTSAPTITGDYHIDPESPVANDGSNIALPADTADVDGDTNTGETLPIDIDGDPRILGGNTDMGADEVNVCLTHTFPHTVAASDEADLVQAIHCANQSPNPDTIILTNSVYAFAAPVIDNPDSALPHITTPITILGGGATLQRTGGPNFDLLHVEATGDLTIRSVTLTGGSAFAGGAIHNLGTATIVGSVLTDNAASSRGGAVYSSSGQTRIVNSTIAGNQTGGDGGGIYLHGASALTVVNSFITGNHAQVGGGGIFVTTGSSASVFNTTIAGNRADSNGGGIWHFGALTVRNSIVWGNSTQIITGGVGSLTVSFSDVQGGVSGTGNVNVDPVFVSPAAFGSAPTTSGDYHIHLESPVINIGSNADVPADTYDADNDGNTVEVLPIDIDGHARILDATVDMGADEETSCIGYTFPRTVAASDEADFAKAIACANRTAASDTITLTNSVYAFTTGAASDTGTALPRITTPIVINGNSATIQRTGGPDFRLLYVTSSGSLTLTSATVTGGITSGDGGGILTLGALTLRGVTVTGNIAHFGGGVLSDAGSLTIVNSVISANTSDASGGGIFTSASATVTSSTIAGNNSINGNGGGIINGSNLTVTNSMIYGNESDSGGGISNASGTLTVRNSTIAGNRVGANGGGILTAGATPAVLTVTNSIIWGNSGSSIAEVGNFTTTVTFSTVQGGFAGAGNSAADPLFVSPVAPASAPTTAGDYHVQAGSPAINTGDKSVLPADTFDLDNDSNTAEPLPVDIDGEPRVNAGLLDMGADEVAGCGIYVFPYAVQPGDEDDFRQAIVCANANADSSTIILPNGSTYGFIDGYPGDLDTATPHVTTPVVINAGGSIIERTTGSPNFRLFFVEAAGSLTLNDATVQGGLVATTGGGIRTLGALTVNNSVITGNSSGDDGGGIWGQNATVTVRDSTITNNSATGTLFTFGGGIYTEMFGGGTLSVIDSTFSGNSVPNGLGGGGIYTASGSATVTNTLITGNTGGLWGGGIIGDPVTITNSTIAGNKSGANSDVSGTGTIVNSIVWGNSIQGLDGTWTVTFSDIQGGHAGAGNINADPLFVNLVSHTFAPTTSGDYHVQADSAALNIGSNAALPADTHDVDGDSNAAETLPLDRGGQTRVVNATVDMGAYEHQTPADVILSKFSAEVTEGGATDSYTVVLASKPSANVTIDLVTTSQITAAPDPLTFTRDNWDEPQTVTITAVDDAAVEGPHTSGVVHQESSTDAAYTLLNLASVGVNITDNDVPGVTVAQSDGTTVVTEGGATDTYTVVLQSVPTASVTITPTGDADCSVSGAVTFLPVEWNTPKTITVTAFDDDIDEVNGEPCAITNAATSGDSNYEGISVAGVSGTVNDNDTAAVIVAPTAVNATEGGATDTFNVSLDTQPTTDVTITVAGDTQCSVDDTSLTFTSLNYATTQPIVVTAINDAVAEGSHTCTVTNTASSGDTNYNAITVSSVTGTITDDDAAGVTVEPTVAVTEGGATETYNVVLTSEPTASVTITPTGDPDCSVGGAITFTSADWDTVKTITATAVNDALIEGTHGCTITNAATSSDPNFNIGAIGSVTGTVTDNDTAGVTVTQSGGTTAVTEGGATDTYTVVLTAQPSANVTITPTGDAQCSVSAAVTFTTAPNDWNTPKTITVTAIDDAIAEGAHSCTVTNAATSGDSAFNGVSVASVAGSVTDDDAFPADIIVNGGFETPGANNSTPSGWTIKNKSADKRLCKPGKPHTGLCAFKFAGSPTENAQLIQVVPLASHTFSAGDTLTLSAYFLGKSTAAKTQLFLNVKYVGGAPTAQSQKITVKRQTVYTQMSLPALTLTAGNVQEIKVTFKHKSKSGSVMVDDVSLIHAPIPSRSDTLPLPSAPDGFRGNS